MRRVLILSVLLSSLCFAATPTLFRDPAVSQTQIVFHYAGDLWIVPREGGAAQRLTSGPGLEMRPYFSPDGKWIAFTGEYDGNIDVFVVAASGGVPRRLTWHPGPDNCVGWTPDGKGVIIRSGRESATRGNKLFVMSVDGVFPSALPFPMGEEAAYSPDGAQLAYVPLSRAFGVWKRYRGGGTTPIWLARLSDSAVVDKIPRENSNDFSPMWVDHRVFFLSDRTTASFSFRIATGRSPCSRTTPRPTRWLRWCLPAD
jgi:tricorn protease